MWFYDILKALFEQYSSKQPRQILNNRRMKPSDDRFEKIGNLISSISSRHRQMKEKLINIKANNNLKEKLQITPIPFSPKLSNSPRYPISGKMSERMKSWDEARMNHRIKTKENLAQQQVKECTFTPFFPSKSKSSKILEMKMLNSYRERRDDETMQKTQREKKKEQERVALNRFQILRTKGKLTFRKNESLSPKSKSVLTPKTYKALQHAIKFEIKTIKFAS